MDRFLNGQGNFLIFSIDIIKELHSRFIFEMSIKRRRFGYFLHKDYKVGFFEIIQSPAKVRIPFKIKISIPILNPEKSVSES